MSLRPVAAGPRAAGRGAGDAGPGLCGISARASPPPTSRPRRHSSRNCDSETDLSRLECSGGERDHRQLRSSADVRPPTVASRRSAADSPAVAVPRSSLMTVSPRSGDGTSNGGSGGSRSGRDGRPLTRPIHPRQPQRPSPSHHCDAPTTEGGLSRKWGLEFRGRGVASAKPRSASGVPEGGCLPKPWLPVAKIGHLRFVSGDRPR